MSDSFVTPWTVAHQVPLSIGFSRQENWSGLPFPSPGDLPNPGIESVPPTLAVRFFTPEPPEKPFESIQNCIITRDFSTKILDIFNGKIKVCLMTSVLK